MLQRNLGAWALVCVGVFSWGAVAAQEQNRSAAAQQSAAAAVVAEPEAPRVVLQAETTASVLRLMKFSGLLRDRAGNLRTGAVGLTFAFYKDQQGGSPLWLEVHNAQLEEQGRYTVLLGSTRSEGLPLELFSSGEARWLGVQVNLPGEEEQARVLLVSVPYALKAADAETLGGKPPSAFLLAEKAEGRETAEAKPEAGKEAVKEGPGREGVVGPINGEGIAGFVAKFTGANNIGSGSIFDTGNVGIGTTNPNAKLSVGNGTIADPHVPVQINTGGIPGSVSAYFGANKVGAYGLLVGYEAGGGLPTGGMIRVVPPGDPLTFALNSSDEAMRITDAPGAGIRVGILSGLQGPKALLSVGQGSLQDKNVPVQISTWPSAFTGAYYGANKFGGYGLLLGLEAGGGVLPMGGLIRMVPPEPLMFFVNNTTEAMRITPAANVGIGTTTPSQKLEVAGNAKVSGIVFPDFTLQTTVGVARSGDTMSGALVLPANGLVAGTNQLVLTGGNVGIGTTTPTEKLHVVGNILATGTITPSARRLKTNIQPLAGALNKIKRLRGVSFAWKESGRHDLGLIAEEVGQVVPEVVAYEENGLDAKGVDYARLTALLIEAVKEQQTQIRQLKRKLGLLKTRSSHSAVRPGAWEKPK